MKIDLEELISNQFSSRQHAIISAKFAAILLSIAFVLAAAPIVIFNVFFGIFGLNQGDNSPLFDREYLRWLVWLFGLMSGFWWLHEAFKNSNTKWPWLLALVASSITHWFVL
jgi:Mg2+ and Co2+ transporter CorA